MHACVLSPVINSAVTLEKTSVVTCGVKTLAKIK